MRTVSGRQAVKVSVLVACVAGASILLLPSRSFATPSLAPQEFDRTARALVRIDADGCSGGARQFQGFLVASSRVLTVRHGIAGCTGITVSFFDGSDRSVVSKVRGARISKVLAAADLAQLELAQPVIDVPPLAVSLRRPEPNTAIFAVARWMGAPGVRDKEMRVANGSGTLRAIVNDKVRRELQAGGSPSLDLEIVNLDIGIIVHGSSGAPIVDSGGTVVAIADGGLDDGFAGINWAVPATEVAHLMTSFERPPGLQEGRLAATHFASQPDVNAGPALTCNGVTLARIGSRTFGDLMEASDDPGGLRLVAGANAASAAMTRYDVYVNIGSGAAVAVPEGARFSQRGDHCVAVSEDGNLTLDLRFYRTSGTPSAQTEMSAVQYDRDVLTPPFGWAPVPAFTYLMAIRRYDGLVVRRKNLWRLDPYTNMWTDSFFETFAARGDLLVAYSVTYRSPGPVATQIAAMCEANPLLPNCGPFIADHEKWGRAAIAVHATTFARGSFRASAGNRDARTGFSE